MTRALALLALSLAALAWLLRRPSRPEPAWDEPEDGVQPVDPMTWRLGVTPVKGGSWVVKTSDIPSAFDSRLPMTTDGRGFGTISTTGHLGIDPTYLEAQAVAVRRGTQSGPLGPSA